jgi:carbon starvation protein CstA
MNIALVPLITVPIFILAIFIYGRTIAKWVGVDKNRKTPAVEMEDGVDYVPTSPWVVFGHHFATIAGAGPIIGPVLAMTYGYVPAWLWVVLGAVFLGAVHDFMGLFVSMREQGRSIADVVKSYLGPTGYFLFLAFTITMLVLVTSSFLNLTAKSLVSVYPLTELQLPQNQTILNTEVILKGTVFNNPSETALKHLNSGRGFSPGSIKIRTAAGLETTVDLSKAATIGDVVKAINSSGAGVSCAFAGGGFIVKDLDNAAQGALTISEAGASTAYSLGIERTSNWQNTVKGLAVLKSYGALKPEDVGIILNRAEGPDIIIKAKSGEVFNIDLGSAATLKEIADVLTDKTARGVRAFVEEDGIVVKDRTQGPNYTVIEDAPGSNAASALNIGKTGAEKDTNGIIGGIATMSVIVITLFAPLIGFLLYKKKLKVWIAFVLAWIVCAVSIIVGIYFPISIDEQSWKWILAIYTMFAAGLPVWLLLQPRDFTNVQILYFGIILLTISVIAAGLLGGVTAGGAGMKDFASPEDFGKKGMGPIWPILFITVACGAISGFHILVAGGTVSKQCRNESHALPIGYGAMLLEALLAVMVVCAMAGCMSCKDYMNVVCAQNNPILGYALAAGAMMHTGLGIPMVIAVVFGILFVEGFAATTLDSAVRLNRYLFEEFWSVIFKGNVPRILKSYWVNSGLCVALMLLFALTNTVDLIWPVFGSANQLLAGLGLITISVWLITKGKKYLFTLLPAAFMIVTTIFALLYVLDSTYLKQMNYLLAVTDILLIALALILVVIAIRVIIRKAGEKRAASG